MRLDREQLLRVVGEEAPRLLSSELVGAVDDEEEAPRDAGALETLSSAERMNPLKAAENWA